VAINRLESTAYYQKTRSLDDYLDEFQDLITDSGYTDPKTIVVKFRRGLNSQIQNMVATMGTGRPSDAKPDAWYSMARMVDQNRATNEAFTLPHRSAPTPARPTGTSFFRPTLPQGHAHSVPTPGNPVPRALTVDELQSALEDRLAQLDVASVDPIGPTEEVLPDQEGFHPDDE
jgi:hypothetical protein